MRKFHLVLIFLLAVGLFILLSPLSLAATHHKGYSPGTAYYSISSLATVGSVVGTIGAVAAQGGITLHINTDGTFVGKVVTNPHSIESLAGSFQPDGRIQFRIVLGNGSYWTATGQVQRDDSYVGIFAMTTLYATNRTGIWSLIPVRDLAKVVSIDVSAITTVGLDQNTPFGGVLILNKRGKGTFRLPDGRSILVNVHITLDKISFTFQLKERQRIQVTGVPSIVSTIVKYTGTFVGPRHGDAGNWYGYPFTFAS